MTQQDKHIRDFFKAFDAFGASLGEGHLAEMKKHREWLERDILKREREKADAIQPSLFR